MTIAPGVDHSPRTGHHKAAVPLVDLALQNDSILVEALEAVGEVCRSGAFVLGEPVRAFESEYAAACGVRECVGVGNGTDALELAVRAAGIRAGDEVIVPANTFVATAEGVERAGGALVLVDCADDFMIDPDQLERSVTARTRAVVGVDLYGQVAPFDLIREAVGEDVILLEDAAQSQGAVRLGQTAGSFGMAAATSFYPGKNLGAFGDAGAVTTDDPDVARLIRQLRNHGGERRYEHSVAGTNSRLDTLQAAVLSIKLRHLAEWNDARRAAALRYHELLAGLEQVVLPRTREGNEHVWHLYVVRVPERDRVLAELQGAGIGAGIHYPAPVHLLPAFAHVGLSRGSLPHAERDADEILSLPLYPGITADQQDRVASVLTQAVRGRKWRS